jgi:hypothetical protein
VNTVLKYGIKMAMFAAASRARLTSGQLRFKMRASFVAKSFPGPQVRRLEWGQLSCQLTANQCRRPGHQDMARATMLG